MSTWTNAPKIPTPEILQWIDEAWTLNSEGVLVWKRDGNTRNIKAGDPIYCGLQSNGYMLCRTSTTPRRTLKAHHLVWYFTTGRWADKEIDHIDGNRANNEFSNLRLVTRSQNRFNSYSSRGHMKGIFERNGKFIAKIGFKGQRIYLGQYSSADLAAAAYQQAAQDLHGEYAYTVSKEVS